MNRNPTLMELAPGRLLRVSERQLGVFFCGETFAFVLAPSTLEAAQRVARWHGCRFQFNPANGSAAFLKLGRADRLLVSTLERMVLFGGHAVSQAQAAFRRLSSTNRCPSAPTTSARAVSTQPLQERTRWVAPSRSAHR